MHILIRFDIQYETRIWHYDNMTHLQAHLPKIKI